MENKIEKLAKNIVNYSIRCKKGDKVLINARDADANIVSALIKEIYNVGGLPFVNESSSKIHKEWLKNLCEENANLQAESELEFMKKMDCFISIKGEINKFETCDINKEKSKLHQIAFDKVHKERVKNTRWVLLISPTPAFAQSAKMSFEQFEDLYYKVCTLDYSKMNKAMDNLKQLMERTDKVQIVSPNTNITFSIKNIPAVKCAGEMNIPDGEVFTAPIKNSVNGIITYNLPTTYNGNCFNNVSLEVKDGKIVKATSDKSDILNSILNTDEGARYFGEFAIGVNPYIRTVYTDSLFDEKRWGSFHFTPGSCYEDEANNGNISAIHWDMVLSQLPEHGGGEIYFDDVLIRKDGMFVLEDLKCLNPENLLWKFEK